MAFAATKSNCIGVWAPRLIRLKLLADAFGSSKSIFPDMLNDRVMTQNHLLTRDRLRNHKLSINLQKSAAVFDDWSCQGPLPGTLQLHSTEEYCTIVLEFASSKHTRLTYSWQLRHTRASGHSCTSKSLLQMS